MADFKRGGDFGGGDRGGSRSGGDFKRGGFGKPRFGGGGGKPSFRPSFNRNEGGRDGEQKEMFDATCTSCGRACQVPFRPSGDRPIFCKDCFSKENDRRGEGPNDSRGRQDSAPRTSVIRRDDSFSQRPAPQSHDPRIDDLKRDIAYAHSKLDKLVELVGAMALTAAVKKAATPLMEVKAPKSEKAEKAEKPKQKKKKVVVK